MPDLGAIARGAVLGRDEAARYTGALPSVSGFVVMEFPISGIEVYPLWPFLIALAVSFACSLGGVSGAFLLLPYQVSVLGFDRPAVSSTNLLFNIVAIPGGIYRFIREGRMLWPLAILMVAGLLPGVALGAWVRLRFLPDPQAFKLFVGLVLLYIAINLARNVLRGESRSGKPAPKTETGTLGTVRTTELGWRRFAYRWEGTTYAFDPRAIFLLVTVVGAVGTTYGIGGGSIMAPILVSVFRLPVYTIAGAALTSTFATSVLGVVVYTWLAPHLVAGGESASPDWLLGGLLGIGGFVGIYLGARCQKYVPERGIKLLLTGILLFVSLRYVGQFLF